MFRIGGTQYELYEGFQDQVRKFIKDFPKKVDEYETLLTENRIWIGSDARRRHHLGKRCDRYGTDRAEPARFGCAVGSPEGEALLRVTRSSSSTFPSAKWATPTIGIMVRMEEMRQSARIVAQAVEKIPDGPIMAKMSKIIKPPVGDIYHSIESPKGELGYYIVSDGSTMAYRSRVRPPSFVNLQALRKMVIGHMVADVVAVIGTLDIVLGEIDR